MATPVIGRQVVPATQAEPGMAAARRRFWSVPTPPWPPTMVSTTRPRRSMCSSRVQNRLTGRLRLAVVAGPAHVALEQDFLLGQIEDQVFGGVVRRADVEKLHRPDLFAVSERSHAGRPILLHAGNRPLSSNHDGEEFDVSRRREDGHPFPSDASHA